VHLKCWEGTCPLPKEGMQLQFRAEFYNLFNHPNLYVNGATPDVSALSFAPAPGAQVPRVTASCKDSRRIVLGMKLLFYGRTERACLRPLHFALVHSIPVWRDSVTNVRKSLFSGNSTRGLDSSRTKCIFKPEKPSVLTLPFSQFQVAPL
jgi:hypothetical protein